MSTTDVDALSAERRTLLINKATMGATAAFSTKALHGTNAQYSAGCRCAGCKAAHATYQREYWRRRKIKARDTTFVPVLVAPPPPKILPDLPLPPPPPLGLDELEQQVLKLLCKEGKAHSSVALTADLYGRASEPDEEKYRTLEWTFVEQILEDLNQQGLVTYKLGAYEIFVHVRPTRKAYEKLGVVFTWIHETMNPVTKHDQPLRVGDPTDFRAHGETAKGVGPVVTEDFIDHCADCALEHLEKHRRQLVELYGTDKI